MRKHHITLADKDTEISKLRSILLDKDSEIDTLSALTETLQSKMAEMAQEIQKNHENGNN